MKIKELQTHSEWLQARTKGIGGSDCATIMGVNPYKTTHELWLEKTGRLHKDIDNPAMFWGRYLEDPIAEHWRDLHSAKFRRFTNPLVQHSTHDWMLASPDRLVHPLSMREGLEVKTAGLRKVDDWGESGTDEIPMPYLCQCQHYLAVTGFDVWHVAALIGGQDYREFEIYPDPELTEAIIEAEQKFWKEHVEADIAPEIDGSEGCRRYLEHRYAKVKDDDILEITSEDVIDTLESYRIAKITEGEAKKRARELENNVLAIIGESKGLTWNGHKITRPEVQGSVSWKSVAEEKGLHKNKELVARHRGDGYRKTTVKWNKEQEANG